MGPKRQIKKTVVKYNEQQEERGERVERQRSRSRQKKIQPPIINQSLPSQKIQQISSLSRRERLQMMKRKQIEQQEINKNNDQIVVKIQESNIKQPFIIQTNYRTEQAEKKITKTIINKPKQQEDNSDENEEVQAIHVLKKPIFISKEYRADDNKQQQLQREQQRKKRNNRYTNKLLMQQDKKGNDSQEENQQTDSQNQNQTDIPDDNDMVNQEYQFQLWKIRQLKRIRRGQEEHRKYQLQRKEIQRRRRMTNQQIFVQNRALGSDATDNLNQTKYVFMQKYYHRGAFYQDSDDQIFKRDYNLPTPMQMQDKSMLPQILQKRIGNFGKKGQSKYTHLTAEDTSDLNPLTRADQSLLDFWKKKTAGYKGSYKSNNL